MILKNNQHHCSQGSSHQEEDVVHSAVKVIQFKPLKEWLELNWNLSKPDLFSVHADQNSSEKWIDQEQKQVGSDQACAYHFKWCAVELLEVTSFDGTLEGQNVDDCENEEFKVTLHKEFGGSDSKHTCVAVFESPNT
jgi:hypothetical protein